MVMTEKFMVPFLGTHFYTDYGELLNYLKSDGYDVDVFQKSFPGVLDAAALAIKDMSSENKPTKKLVYINGYMQAWPSIGEPGKAFRNPYLPTDL
jgi:hypothetical protein